PPCFARPLARRSEKRAKWPSPRGCTQFPKRHAAPRSQLCHEAKAYPVSPTKQYRTTRKQAEFIAHTIQIDLFVDLDPLAPAVLHIPRGFTAIPVATHPYIQEFVENAHLPRNHPARRVLGGLGDHGGITLSLEMHGD